MPKGDRLFPAVKQETGDKKFKYDHQVEKVMTQWVKTTGHGVIFTGKWEVCIGIRHIGRFWRVMCGNVARLRCNYIRKVVSSAENETLQNICPVKLNL